MLRPSYSTDHWLLMMGVCVYSTASSDPAVPRGHEDPGGGEGGDPLQVLWSSAHHLHLVEVQETSEKHPRTEAVVIDYWGSSSV